MEDSHLENTILMLQREKWDSPNSRRAGMLNAMRKELFWYRVPAVIRRLRPLDKAEKLSARSRPSWKAYKQLLFLQRLIK